MNRSVLWLLWLLHGVSSDEIPTPKVTRDYQSSTDLKQKCVIACLVSSVTQANLLWINGSVLYSSLMITDLNTKLYLVLDYQDKNNYSCVVSSSGVNQTTHLNVSRICKPCRDENLTMSASEGDSVTLPTNLTQVQYEDHIEWIHKNACIAELYKNSPTYHDCDICKLNNRLQLDNKTGSLTITNISKIHSALYKLRITNVPLEECLTKSYNVTVYDRLPLPVITKNSTRCSSSSKCVVMCSVNVTGDTLSWYNGSRLNSSISVSDLKRSNFLCLEVEYQDTNTYRCVVNNSFTNKTTRLDINDLCKVPWYSKTGVIVGLSIVGVGVGVGVFVALCCYCIKRCQCCKPAQNDGAPDSNSNAGASLMGHPSSSSSSIHLNPCCCKYN